MAAEIIVMKIRSCKKKVTKKKCQIREKSRSMAHTGAYSKDDSKKQSRTA